MALAYLTSGIFTGTFNSAGDAISTAFDAGSASDRYLLVGVRWEVGGPGTLPTIDGVTYNSVSLSSLGSDLTQSGNRAQLFGLAGPASGSNTLQVDPSTHATSDRAATYGAWVAQDVNQTTPTENYNTGQGTSSTSAVTITSESGDLVAVFHTWSHTRTSSSESGFTQRQENLNGHSCMNFGDASGSASVATSVTLSGTAQWIALGASVNPVSAATSLFSAKHTIERGGVGLEMAAGLGGVLH